MVVTNPASQVIAALIVGLLIAFTCQLLLTNLGLAIGITIWGGQSWTAEAGAGDPGGGDRNSDDDESSATDAVSLETLSIAAGLGLLLTVNGVLFVACYAAVKFCAPVTAFSGSVLGLVIWSAYLLAMTWVSTRAANSLVAFILSSAVSGLRQIFTALSAVMQSVFGDSETQLTPTAVAELVRQETQASLDQVDIPTLIDAYIDERMPPQLDLDTLQPQFETTLQQSNLTGLKQQGVLPQLDFGAFLQWVKDELGVVGEIAEAIADQLYQSWQRVTDSPTRPLQQLQDLFSSASVDDLTPEALSPLLEHLPSKGSTWRGPGQPAQDVPSESADPKNKSTNTTVETLKDAVTKADIGRQLRQTLRQRIDLADLDIQAIWNRVSPLLQDWLASDPDTVQPDLDGQVIREDMDDYLRQVPPWRLTHETLQQDVQEVLIDPDAAVDQVLPQIMALGPEDFAHSLEQRGDLDRAQINALADQLDAIRRSAIATLTKDDPDANNSNNNRDLNPAVEATPAQQEAIADLQQKLENYLHYTSLSQVTPAAIADKVTTLVDASSVSAATLRQALPQLPTAALADVLSRRQGLAQSQQDRLIQQVQDSWQQQTEAQSLPPEAMLALEGAIILGMAQIISRTVDIEALRSKLMPSLEKAVGGPQALRQSLTQVDWRSLRQKAQTQLEGSDAQVEQASRQIQTALTDILKPPRRWALRRTAEVNDFWTSVSDYLTHSSPDQLSPSAIRQNLEWLWRTSNRGLYALQDISVKAIEAAQSLDWAALKANVSQRQDLSADQIDAVWSAIDLFVQELLHQLAEARQQAQASLESWFDAVKSVLQDPDHLAFNPDSVKGAVRELLPESPNMLSTLQPLKLLTASEGIAETIAQLSQEAFSQVLKAQGVPDALLAQAAELKDWVQDQVVEVENDIRERQAALQQGALQQLDDARKALAAAAWWLFAIAVTSATTAVVAGILAVIGVDGILAQVSHMLQR